MQILLANAKIMNSKAPQSPVSTPAFQEVSNSIAEEMSQMDVITMAQALGCSPKLAAENWKRYQDFPFAEKMPAILAYNGQAYKHLKASTLSEKALSYAQSHLWITCFLYGLLRPLDGIVPYRMEHTATLEITNDRPINQFWKDKLTDFLIDCVKADDGILIHLSTEEYEHLFDWKRVCKEVKVIQPLFYVRNSNGALKVQAVWAKSCRGAMVRYILENEISTPADLNSFSYEGFHYTPQSSTDSHLIFVKE